MLIIISTGSKWRHFYLIAEAAVKVMTRSQAGSLGQSPATFPLPHHSHPPLASPMLPPVPTMGMLRQAGSPHQVSSRLGCTPQTWADMAWSMARPSGVQVVWAGGGGTMPCGRGVGLAWKEDIPAGAARRAH